MPVDAPAKVGAIAVTLRPAHAAAAAYSLARTLRSLPLIAIFPDGSTLGAGDRDSPALIIAKPDELLARLVTNPERGLGEGFIAREWRPAPGTDLTTIVRILGRALVDGAHGGGVRARVSRRVLAYVPPMPPRAAVPDGLVALLGAALAQSCALSSTPGEKGLEDPITSVLDEAGVTADTRVLDWSSGWDGLAVAAAQRGARVSVVAADRTVEALINLAADAAGVSHLIDTLAPAQLASAGVFDSVIGAGLFFGAAQRAWQEVLGLVGERLAPGGTALLHSIVTVSDTREHDAARTWFGDYLGSGALLPALADVTAHTSQLHGMDRVSVSRARSNVCAVLADQQLDVVSAARCATVEQPSAEVRRMTQYALAWLEAGFADERLDVARVAMVRSRLQGPANKAVARVRRLVVEPLP